MAAKKTAKKTAGKPRLGMDSPLDFYETRAKGVRRPAAKGAGKGAAKKAAPAPAEPARIAITVHISPALADASRDVVYACRLTLGAFVESALREAIRKAERAENGGKPFPKRPVEKLRTGRLV